MTPPEIATWLDQRAALTPSLSAKLALLTAAETIRGGDLDKVAIPKDAAVAAAAEWSRA